MSTALKKLKQKDQELKIKENAISSFQPLYNHIRSKVEKEVSNNNIEILKSGLSEFIKTNSVESLSKVIEKMSFKSEDQRDEMISYFKQMIDSLSLLEKKNYFDLKEFNSIFTNGLSKILNILIDQNEIPFEQSYIRDSQDKIKMIVEKYDGYILKHEWIYNSKGYLTKVNTTKNETK